MKGKADLYFCEELDRLKVDKRGLIGMGLWQHQHPFVNKTVITRKDQQTRNQNIARRLSCTDLKTKSDFADSEADCEDLHAHLLAKLKSVRSFFARTPSSKIGLLFTDAASTIMTKSFLERALKCESC